MIILELLAEKEIPFPDKMSLFASGHVPFASLLKVSLCTMQQPFHELGRRCPSCSTGNGTRARGCFLAHRIRRFRNASVIRRREAAGRP